MESKEKSMVDFIKKLTEDQALQERMSKAANPEEAYGIAKENGVTVSFDEFRETMKVLAAMARGELSEEEMQAIAGGGDGTDVILGGLVIGFTGVVGGLLSVMGGTTVGVCAIAAL